MSRFVEVDLSQVPPPNIIDASDFNSLKTVTLEDAIARLAADGIQYNVGTLESDPIVKLVEAFAFRELTLRKRINDSVRATMLTSSFGTDLDTLGTLVATQRLTIGAVDAQPAIGTIAWASNPNALDIVNVNGVVITFVQTIPVTDQVALGKTLDLSLVNLLSYLENSNEPLLQECTYNVAGNVLTVTAVTPGVAGNQVNLSTTSTGSTITRMANGADAVVGLPESDDAYRRRIQLAPEAFSNAGPADGYVYFALSVLGSQGCIDASAIMTRPGYVTLTLLMGSGVYTPTQAQRIALYQFFVQSQAKPLTDVLSILPPNIVPVNVIAQLTLYPGPSGSLILKQAQNALNDLINQSSTKLGHSFTISQIEKALQQPGVRSVQLTSPLNDINLDPTQVLQAATSISLNPVRKT